MIPAEIDRRARWVLDSIGASDVGFGDDVPYNADAWERVDRGERPEGDDLAEGFFHLARVEEKTPGPRDEHGRFRAEWSSLDPLDPPLERLRRRLGVVSAGGPRFRVALTHDVDSLWRWTRIGLRGAAARLKQNVRHARLGPAMREATGLATAPLYSRRRPRLVETLLGAGAEVGLHGSYSAADDPVRLAAEKQKLEALTGPIAGHRYHYLRVDPHRNLAPLAAAGLRYDTTLGFPDAVGFRAGIARPFRPWSFERDEPLDLVEIPLAAMDATLADERYLGLAAKRAEPQLMRLLDWAAEYGGAFAVLWHPDRFDPATSAGWDSLYSRLLAGVQERGGSCVPAAELVSSHST
ncbi:MAG: hypothetical protein E6G09_01565 [Actinobacteria bacterium]|nr:MAG: hypothetical protein E6G09_01565 [Actinomycetota bacterium]